MQAINVSNSSPEAICAINTFFRELRKLNHEDGDAYHVAINLSEDGDAYHVAINLSEEKRHYFSLPSITTDLNLTTIYIFNEPANLKQTPGTAYQSGVAVVPPLDKLGTVRCYLVTIKVLSHSFTNFGKPQVVDSKVHPAHYESITFLSGAELTQAELKLTDDEFWLLQYLAGYEVPVDINNFETKGKVIYNKIVDTLLDCPYSGGSESLSYDVHPPITSKCSLRESNKHHVVDIQKGSYSPAFVCWENKHPSEFRDLVTTRNSIELYTGTAAVAESMLWHLCKYTAIYIPYSQVTTRVKFACGMPEAEWSLSTTPEDYTYMISLAISCHSLSRHQALITCKHRVGKTPIIYRTFPSSLESVISKTTDIELLKLIEGCLTILPDTLIPSCFFNRVDAVTKDPIYIGDGSGAISRREKVTISSLESESVLFKDERFFIAKGRSILDNNYSLSNIYVYKPDLLDFSSDTDVALSYTESLNNLITDYVLLGGKKEDLC